MVNDKNRLIVGLGNPGLDYATTRHNMGQILVEAFAKQNNFTLKKEKRLSGYFIKARYLGFSLYLLIPITYMNCSGAAVRSCMDFYKINPEDILIIADDIDISFGEMRIKPKGSSGGHQGLKNIEKHLKTQEYARLRIGVGDRQFGSLADHVLSKFSKQEMIEMGVLLEKGIRIINLWLENEIEVAMNYANVRQQV